MLPESSACADLHSSISALYGFARARARPVGGNNSPSSSPAGHALYARRSRKSPNRKKARTDKPPLRAVFIGSGSKRLRLSRRHASDIDFYIPAAPLAVHRHIPGHGIRPHPEQLVASAPGAADPSIHCPYGIGFFPFCQVRIFTFPHVHCPHPSLCRASCPPLFPQDEGIPPPCGMVTNPYAFTRLIEKPPPAPVLLIS